MKISEEELKKKTVAQLKAMCKEKEITIATGSKKADIINLLLNGSAEEKKPEPKKEAPKPEPKKEAPKPEPKKEAPKPEPKKEAPKPEPKKEAPKPKPKKEKAPKPKKPKSTKPLSEKIKNFSKKMRR